VTSQERVNGKEKEKIFQDLRGYLFIESIYITAADTMPLKKNLANNQQVSI